MTLYIYREETEDTLPCLEFQKPHPQDMDIVLEGATDVQGTILAEALNVEFETGKTPRQLAEENAKLRELLKESKSLVKEMCQTYNNPFPDASFERFNEALKD